MQKVYFLVPLLGTILFGFYYANFNRGFQEREQARLESVRVERENALRQEAIDRKEAIEEALRLQEERKQEKATRNAREEAKKKQREDALDEREKAYREQQRLAKQVERFQGDVATVEEDIAKVEKNKEIATGEIAFLQKYVTAAERNVSNLSQVLQRIQAADDAAAAAAAAAAAVAAQKKS
jgi:hypothetical protein